MISTLVNGVEKLGWTIKTLLESLWHVLKMYAWSLSENQTWGSGPLLCMACMSPVRYSAPLNLASTRWYCLFIATIWDFVYQNPFSDCWDMYNTQYSCIYVIIFCMVLSKNSYQQEYSSSIQGLCHQTKAFISQQPLNGFWWINSRVIAMKRQYHLVLARFSGIEYLMGLIHAMWNNGPLFQVFLEVFGWILSQAALLDTKGNKIALNFACTYLYTCSKHSRCVVKFREYLNEWQLLYWAKP